MSRLIQSLVVLSEKEFKFLQDLKTDNMENYTQNYIRVFKHRILKKHKQLAHEPLVIDEVLDKLQAL
jgi:hypothetical protein